MARSIRGREDREEEAVKSATDLVKEAKAMIENLSVDQVSKELERGAVLIDVREPMEVETQGRSPGSKHAVRGLVEFYADEALPYHRPEFDRRARLILCCASGSRSALACKTLREMGYDVAHLEGGIQAWRAASKPMEGGRPS